MTTARTASGRQSLRYIVKECFQNFVLYLLQDADGNVVGSFVIALPDGRVQTVAYTADHYNGFVAQVTYEGTPVYPELPKGGYGAGQAVRRF